MTLLYSVRKRFIGLLMPLNLISRVILLYRCPPNMDMNLCVCFTTKLIFIHSRMHLTAQNELQIDNIYFLMTLAS